MCKIQVCPSVHRHDSQVVFSFQFRNIIGSDFYHDIFPEFICQEGNSARSSLHTTRWTGDLPIKLFKQAEELTDMTTPLKRFTRNFGVLVICLFPFGSLTKALCSTNLFPPLILIATDTFRTTIRYLYENLYLLPYISKNDRINHKQIVAIN